MDDPRVIPRYIEYLRLNPNAEFYDSDDKPIVIQSIITLGFSFNDSNKDYLNAAMEGCSPFERRVIEDLFQSPNEFIERNYVGSDYYNNFIVNFIRQGEIRFLSSDLSNLAMKEARKQGVVINNRSLIFFYASDGLRVPNTGIEDVEKVLLQSPNELAMVIAKSKLPFVRAYFPLLLDGLTNPIDDDYFFFPKMIATEGLDLDRQSLDRLKTLYNLAELKMSTSTRGVFAEGLLFLSSKDQGKEVARSILAASTGASRDQGQIRKVFRMLRILDTFNTFSFTPKDSLNEIADDLRGKVVETVRDKLGLTEEELPALQERLDYLLESSTVEIISTLLANLKEKQPVAQVVREIGRHIVLDDFRDWRNSLETSVAQLAVLPQEAQKAGMSVSRQPVEVFVPQSYNDYEYSDTLGGNISQFDRYVPLQNAVVVR